MRAWGEIRAQEPMGQGLNYGGMAHGGSKVGGPLSCPSCCRNRAAEGAWLQGGISWGIAPCSPLWGCSSFGRGADLLTSGETEAAASLPAWCQRSRRGWRGSCSTRRAGLQPQRSPPSPGIAPGLSHGGEEKGQPFSCRVTYSTPGSGWRQQQPRGWGRKGWREASGAAGGGTWGARGAGLTGAVPSAPARRGGKAASANLHHGLAFDAQSILTLLFPPPTPTFFALFQDQGGVFLCLNGVGAAPAPHILQ